MFFPDNKYIREDGEDLVIYPDTRRSAWRAILICVVGGSILSLVQFLIAYQDHHLGRHATPMPPLYMFFLMWPILLFPTFATLIDLIRRSRKPLVILSRNGIGGNVPELRNWFTNWANVQAIESTGRGSERIVILQLASTQSEKGMLRQNINLLGIMLPMSVDQFMALVASYRSKAPTINDVDTDNVWPPPPLR